MNSREYRFFKILNRNKLDFDFEKDQHIINSILEANESDYEVELSKIFNDKVTLMSKYDDFELNYQIFKTYNLSLRKKELFSDSSSIQSYFLTNYKSNFFFDFENKNANEGFRELIYNISKDEFKSLILPKLKLKLFNVIDKSDIKTNIIYNWDFYEDIGGYLPEKANILGDKIGYLPYNDCSKAKSLKSLKYISFTNMLELVHSAPDLKLKGLIINEVTPIKSFSSKLFKIERCNMYKSKYRNNFELIPIFRDLSELYKGKSDEFEVDFDILYKVLIENESPFSLVWNNEIIK